MQRVALGTIGIVARVGLLYVVAGLGLLHVVIGAGLGISDRLPLAVSFGRHIPAAIVLAGLILASDVVLLIAKHAIGRRM